MDPLPITLFADFSCPFSYLTESALRRIESPRISIERRAFELFPEPDPLGPPEFQNGVPPEAATLAEAEGLTLRAVDFRPRTGKAHEAALFARSRGKEVEIREQIHAAYWAEARDIGRIDVLMDLAARVGFDPEDLKIALDIDLHTAEVAGDGSLAHRLRIPGTPTLFLGRGPDARVLTGAHGYEALAATVAEALAFFDNQT